MAFLEAIACMEAAAKVAANPARWVFGCPRRRVPKMGVVQEHVSTIDIEGNLARDLFESQGHPFGVVEMAPR